jgi:hypothetical protein
VSGLRKSKCAGRVRARKQSAAQQGLKVGVRWQQRPTTSRSPSRIPPGNDIVACEPREARRADRATRIARSLSAMEGHCETIAFSRTGGPALGGFNDALILKTAGDVDSGVVVRLASNYQAVD